MTTWCCHGYHSDGLCVSHGPAASGPALCAATPSVTSLSTFEPPRVVMSVEDFYYGTFEGDLSLRKPQPLGIKTCTFICQICSHLADNNLRWDQNPIAPETTWMGSDVYLCGGRVFAAG